MRIAIVMTLLLVAFSTVSLAIEPIERAALDLVMARGDDEASCGKFFYPCRTSEVCCENYVCDRSLCKYDLFG
nr:Tx-46 [Heteropoda pingtungensis]